MTSRKKLLAPALVLIACIGIPNALASGSGDKKASSLGERFRIAQDLASELLARGIAANEDGPQTASGAPSIGANLLRQPTRYEVSVAVSEFLQILDNLHALAGEKPLVPLDSNPLRAFEKSSGKAIAELKAKY